MSRFPFKNALFDPLPWRGLRLARSRIVISYQSSTPDAGLPMRSESFFDESTAQSRIKATIVRDYFWAWAKVILPTVKRRGGRIAYIDLFAGKGRYKDGTKST